MSIPLNIDWQQILLHLFNFVILAFALYFILYKPVKAFMDKREKDIKTKNDDADNAKKEAEELKAEYEQKIADAEKAADEIKAEAAKNAEIAAHEITDKADKEAQALKERARTVIEKEHHDMIEGAKTEIAELATEAARKVVEGDDYDSFSNAVNGGEEK